jgi:hypothetical protein
VVTPGASTSASATRLLTCTDRFDETTVCAAVAAVNA